MAAAAWASSTPRATPSSAARVALKFLPPQWSHDEGAKQRFIREAQAASATDHPNICTIHDIGTAADGQLFIVMAHYDGQTLKSASNADACRSTKPSTSRRKSPKGSPRRTARASSTATSSPAT